VSIWDPKKTLESLGGSEKLPNRASRIGEAIREELSILLISGVQDPRLAGLSISRVEVAGDLSLAKIFYTNRGDKKEAETALRKAKGFMRSHIAKTLNLRFTPDLQFRYDDTIAQVEELEKIFQEIADERQTREPDSSEDTGRNPES